MSGESEKDPSPEQAARELMNELIRLRKRQGVGQEPLAKAIGISQSRLSQIENLKGGSMSLDVFLQYAQMMGAEVVLLPPNVKKKP